MSTAAVYNGFGRYEENDKGEKGSALMFGGVRFWLPYQKVTYFPDYTFREVDHRESTADSEAEGVLTYKTVRVLGGRLVEELLETQIPYTNSSKGIVLVAQDKRKLKDNYVVVLAGYSEDGQAITVEVQEILPSQEEKDRAEKLALSYKERMIKDYLQSKREHMAGHQGQSLPSAVIQAYMDELGVKDIDDLSRQTGTGGLDALIELIKRANGPAEPVFAQPAPKIIDKRTAADLV